MSDSDAAPPELYRLVKNESWVKVVQRATSHPHEAKYVEPTSNITCLHLAVKKRQASNPSSRIAAIRALLQCYPEAAAMADSEFCRTPLSYACLVDTDNPKSFEDDSEVVRLIVEFHPQSLQVLSRDGYSPLELHVMAMSSVKRKGDAMGIRRQQKSRDASTSILKALLQEETSAAGLTKALDVLFECNSFAVLEQVALEEAQASSLRLLARRQARSSGGSVQPARGSTNFTNFWVWQWALLLFEADYARRYASSTSSPPFLVMHAAAQVKDFPIPFMILAMRAHPEQVRQVDERTGNLPLHFIAAWDVSDPSTVSRKSMALNALVSEYPQAGRVRNKRGKTPMSLALESGTSWDNGVRRLTSFRVQGSASVSVASQSVRSLR